MQYNYHKKKAIVKIVYYGPGLCGKTTNLEYIYNHLTPDSRVSNTLMSIPTQTDRTIFFEALPVKKETTGGWTYLIQHYTVPGQVFYATTRKAVLSGADGIVFVADSQAIKREENIQSIKELKTYLSGFNLNYNEMPVVLQFNKRDLDDIMPVEQMLSDLRHNNETFFEAVAVEGTGVMETQKKILDLTIERGRGIA